MTQRKRRPKKQDITQKRRKVTKKRVNISVKRGGTVSEKYKDVHNIFLKFTDIIDTKNIESEEGITNVDKFKYLDKYVTSVDGIDNKKSIFYHNKQILEGLKNEYEQKVIEKRNESKYRKRIIHINLIESIRDTFITTNVYTNIMNIIDKFYRILGKNFFYILTEHIEFKELLFEYFKDIDVLGIIEDTNERKKFVDYIYKNIDKNTDKKKIEKEKGGIYINSSFEYLRNVRRDEGIFNQVPASEAVQAPESEAVQAPASEAVQAPQYAPEFRSEHLKKGDILIAISPRIDGDDGYLNFNTNEIFKFIQYQEGSNKRWYYVKKVDTEEVGLVPHNFVQ